MNDRNWRVIIHELTAAFVALGLVIAVSILAMSDHSVPDVLIGAMGAAVGWVFGAGVNGTFRRSEPRNSDPGGGES